MKPVTFGCYTPRARCKVSAVSRQPCGVSATTCFVDEDTSIQR